MILKTRYVWRRQQWRISSTDRTMRLWRCSA